jgi:hypothetical protein
MPANSPLRMASMASALFWKTCSTLHAETLKDDVARVVGGAAHRVEADLLAGQILDGLDLRADVEVELALEHRDHVVDAPLDAGNFSTFLKWSRTSA